MCRFAAIVFVVVSGFVVLAGRLRFGFVSCRDGCKLSPACRLSAPVHPGGW